MILFFRFLARKACKELIYRREESATTIQKTWRMISARKRYLATLELQRRDRAAICIQKCWRGFLAGKLIKSLRLKREMSAVVIQKNWKRFVVRKNHLETVANVVKVQVNNSFQSCGVTFLKTVKVTFLPVHLLKDHHYTF